MCTYSSSLQIGHCWGGTCVPVFKVSLIFALYEHVFLIYRFIRSIQKGQQRIFIRYSHLTKPTSWLLKIQYAMKWDL